MRGSGRCREVGYKQAACYKNSDDVRRGCEGVFPPEVEGDETARSQPRRRILVFIKRTGRSGRVYVVVTMSCFLSTPRRSCGRGAANLHVNPNMEVKGRQEVEHV
ncbi:Hypothetical predicted protein [Xyrichtys novacula]|uniref:Uncharacterized protein n=1 Tax=Xyrichtys novacula TaxID=13765 RepID=A0AAV1FVD0_XYRNO|nr:Hypothetical predicted protein [Xyrichtys novacula]